MFPFREVIFFWNKYAGQRLKLHKWHDLFLLSKCLIGIVVFPMALDDCWTLWGFGLVNFATCVEPCLNSGCASFSALGINFFVALLWLPSLSSILCGPDLIYCFNHNSRNYFLIRGELWHMRITRHISPLPPGRSEVISPTNFAPFTGVAKILVLVRAVRPFLPVAKCLGVF